MQSAKQKSLLTNVQKSEIIAELSPKTINTNINIETEFETSEYQTNLQLADIYFRSIKCVRVSKSSLRFGAPYCR